MTSQAGPSPACMPKPPDEIEKRRPTFKRKLEDDREDLWVRNVRRKSVEETGNGIGIKLRLEVNSPGLEADNFQPGLIEQFSQGSSTQSQPSKESRMDTAAKFGPHGSHSILGSEGSSNLGISEF